jgi:hypothetical protein
LNSKIDGRGRRGDGSVHVNTEINEGKMEEMDQQTNLLGKLGCLRNPGNLYKFHWSPFFPAKAITNLTTNSFYLGDFTHLQDPHSRLVSCILQPQLLLLLCPTGPVVMPIIFLLPRVGLAHCCIWSAPYTSEVFPNYGIPEKKSVNFL